MVMENKAMNIYTVIIHSQQDAFVDSHGENARPSSEIAGIFNDENEARKLQEELINRNAHDIIAFDADEIDVEIQEWEVIK